MHRAHEENDAGRHTKNAKHQHPGRPGGTGRKDRAKFETMQPDEIAATPAKRCANQKLQNTHQHHATPEQAASTARPVNSFTARIRAEPALAKSPAFRNLGSVMGRRHHCTMGTVIGANVCMNADLQSFEPRNLLNSQAN